MAWLLAGHPQIVPIPGTPKAHRLAEKYRAAQVARDAWEVVGVEAS